MGELKSHINKLSEANLHSICNEVQLVYRTKSRALVTEVLAELIIMPLDTADRIPERLIIEHAMLVSIITCNIGVQVVSHFVEKVCKMLDELFREEMYGCGKK